jgi:hypothetical protein
MMCWGKLFKKTIPDITPTSVPIPVPRPDGGLPYPEEQPDNTKNTTNTTIKDAKQVFSEWLAVYSVPSDKTSWWQEVEIILDDTKVAATDSKNKRMWISPAWLNHGVIAHEMAHISYWQLKAKKKRMFEQAYLATNEPLVLQVKQERTSNEASIIEAHAEIYRFLGKYMPASFHEFYPFLF